MLNTFETLNGHSSKINGLSFSRDGRLLASCALDRTVNLWWMPDLVDTIDHIGGLPPGMKVKQVTGGVQISSVGNTGLVAGDLIHELRVGNGWVPQTSAFEFLVALSALKPGDQTFVRMKPPGNPPSFGIELGQAADQRNPLCTLFFTRDEDNRWSWIGWSPLGAFETSDKSIEQYVGWHFNPRKLDELATFEPIETRRKDYFGRGLLRRLIERGGPGIWPDGVANAWPYFDAGKATSDKSHEFWQVPNPNIDFFVIVDADNLEQIKAVKVENVENGKDIPLEPYAGESNRWRGDFSKLANAGDIARLRIKIQMTSAGRDWWSGPQSLFEVQVGRPPQHRVEPVEGKIRTERPSQVRLIEWQQVRERSAATLTLEVDSAIEPRLHVSINREPFVDFGLVFQHEPGKQQKWIATKVEIGNLPHGRQRPRAPGGDC